MKKIPRFKNENQERVFWQKNDSIDFLDWEKAKPVVFSNLKPTTKPISIRLPEYLIIQLKVKANKIDIPYQSLMKKYLAQGLREKF